MSDLLKYIAENLTEKDIEIIRLSTQLLPCPFCGGEVVVDEIEPHIHSNPIFPDFGGSVYAECPNCDFYMSKPTVEELEEAWNRRVK